MPDLVSVWNWLSEYLQRLVLRCRCEGKVAGVGEQLPRLHDLVDLILEGLILVLLATISQHIAHRPRGFPALARMGLVDDDGKFFPAMLVPEYALDIQGRKRLVNGFDYLTREQRFSLRNLLAKHSAQISIAHRLFLLLGS